MHFVFKCITFVFEMQKPKFNIIVNITCKHIVKTVSLDELIDIIKNPNREGAEAIKVMRQVGKGSSNYDIIKKNISCFIPMFNHNSYVKGDSRTQSTGMLYLDFDYDIGDFDFSKYPFVVAAWKSVSGIGHGVLVSIDSLSDKITTEGLRENISNAASLLGLSHDSAAVSVDRCCVISYDENVYYNPSYSSIKALKPIHGSVEYTKEKKTLKTSKNNVLEKNPTGSKDSIEINSINEKKSSNNDSYYTSKVRCVRSLFKNVNKVSDLPEKIRDLVWEENEIYKHFPEGIPYLEVWLKRGIKEGQRHMRLFNHVSSFLQINNDISLEDFSKVVHMANRCCDPPLPKYEINTMIRSCYERKDNLEYRPNRVAYYVFNPDIKLTKREKAAIINKKRGKELRKKYDKKVLDVIDNWDFDKWGKITLKKIHDCSKVSMNAIKSRKPLIADAVKELYEESQYSYTILK